MGINNRHSSNEMPAVAINVSPGFIAMVFASGCGLGAHTFQAPIKCKSLCDLGDQSYTNGLLFTVVVNLPGAAYGHEIVGSGLQNPLLVTLQHQACQHPGIVCPGIDTNTVGKKLGFRRDGVAMDDDGAVVPGALQELVTYP